MTEKNLTAHYLSGLIAEKKREQKQINKDLIKLFKMRNILLQQEKQENENL